MKKMIVKNFFSGFLKIQPLIWMLFFSFIASYSFSQSSTKENIIENINTLIENNQINQAKEIIKNTLGEKKETEKIRIELILDIIDIYNKEGKREKSIQLLNNQLSDNYFTTIENRVFLYRELSKQYILQKDLDNAEIAISKGLSFDCTTDTCLQSFFSLIQNKAIIFYYRNEIDSSIYWYKKSLDHLKKYSIENEHKALTLQNIAISYFKKNDIQNTIRYFEMGIQESYRTGNTYNLGEIYIKYGSIMFRWHQYNKAIEYYRKAEEIIKPNEGNELQLKFIYQNLGKCYIIKGDYFYALNYFNNALNIRNFESKYQLGDIILDIAIIYIALNNFNKTNTLLDSSLLGKHYYNLEMKQKFLYLNAQAYSRSGNFDRAEYYFEKSIELYHSSKNINAINTYSEHLIKYSKYNQAISLLNEIISENIFIKYADLDKYLTYVNLSTSYLKTENYDSSLFFINKAISSLTTNWKPHDKFDFPEISQTINFIKLSNSLNKKAIILEKMYRENSAPAYLNYAYKCFAQSIEITEQNRLEYQSEDSKLEQSKDYGYAYKRIVRILVELDKLYPTKNYGLLAYEYLEKSKAAVLFNALNELNVHKSGVIPDSLLNKERNYKEMISFYETKIYNEKNSENPDQNTIKEYETHLLKINKEYLDLKNLFKKQYSGYYNAMHKDHSLTLNDIQKKIAPNTIILEYMFYSDRIYIFEISSKNYKIHITDIDEDILNKDIENYYQLIYKPDFTNNSKQQFSEFTDISYSFFELLLKNTNYKNFEKLIIIPTASFYSIPFETFIQQPIKSKKPDYKNLPYLIKDKDISYAYSTNLLFVFDDKQHLNSNDILAFAPVYNVDFTEIKDPEKMVLRNQLASLPASLEEINSINKYFNVKSFVEKDAGVSSFLENYQNYAIIHLAMHTLVDEDNPLFSRLVFSSESQNEPYSYLYAHQIYYLNMNARMIVLSACNTGVGQYKKGEGVYSIARSFMYSGCPSVLMTLWTIEDNTGSEIMDYYYKNISKGNDLDHALRNAKLSYLKQADPAMAHPYFWAAYVNLGQNKPLLNQSISWWIIVFPAMALAIIVMIYTRRKRRAAV
jgi:CHAT domain-containing protein